MAKKEKVTLTPEEIEAKKARKKEKRIIFGKTFERAIVWLLAVVLVYSVTYISLNNKGVAAVSATPAQSGSQNAGGSASKSDWDTSANGSGSSQSGSQSSTSGDNASGGNAAAATGVDAAAAAEAINAATAKAVAAGYHWTRSAQYTQPIDVGNATGALNKIIQGIDSEASLDSVVGGFLGIGDKEMDIERAAAQPNRLNITAKTMLFRQPLFRQATSRILRLTATPTPLRLKTQALRSMTRARLCQGLQTTSSLRMKSPVRSKAL